VQPATARTERVITLPSPSGKQSFGSEGSRAEERPVAGQPFEPARIVVADDHPLFRSALRTLLEGSEEVEVIAEAADGKETLEFSRRLEPDLVLMDVIMPKMDGVAATRAIKSELPRTIVLMMTASEDSEHLLSALRAGAGGYVLKSDDPEQITEAVHKVLRGEFPLDQEVATRLLLRLSQEKHESQEERVSPVPEALSAQGRRISPAAADDPDSGKLSPREAEVLRLMAKGCTNEQIARELLLSTSTVKNHVGQILSKLGASDRTQAAIMAIERGLISISH
jgi:DNA-binding NarL/FixJ family response regulator